MFRCHSFSLNTAQCSEDALDAECKQLISTTKDKCTTPDAFFLCAGSSQPGYFVEKTEGQLLYGMEQAYWVEAWTAHVSRFVTLNNFLLLLVTTLIAGCVQKTCSTPEAWQNCLRWIDTLSYVFLRVFIIHTGKTCA